MRLQEIAAENNLSETAFFKKADESYELRWFTPKVEVDLCGHATLAAAWIIAMEIGDRSEVLNFRHPKRPAACSAGRR